MTKSFGSQIRGGESSCRVRLSTEPGAQPGRHARRRGRAQLGRLPEVRRRAAGRRRHHRHLRRARPASRPTSCRSPASRPREALAVPIARAWRGQPPGTDKAKNTVVLGLLAGWFGIAPRRDPRAASARSFAKKGARGARGATSAPSRAGRRRTPREHPLRQPRALDAPARDRGTEAAHRRQRHVRRRRDLRRLRVLRRLPDHAVDRDHAVPQPRDLEVRRRGAAGRGRDRRHRRGASAPRSPARRR